MSVTRERNGHAHERWRTGCVRSPVRRNSFFVMSRRPSFATPPLKHHAHSDTTAPRDRLARVFHVPRTPCVAVCAAAALHVGVVPPIPPHSHSPQQDRSGGVEKQLARSATMSTFDVQVPFPICCSTPDQNALARGGARTVRSLTSPKAVSRTRDSGSVAARPTLD